MKTLGTLISNTAKKRLHKEFSSLQDAVVTRRVRPENYKVRLVNSGVVVNVTGAENLAIGSRVVIGSISGDAKRYTILSNGSGANRAEDITVVAIPNPYA